MKKIYFCLMFMLLGCVAASATDLAADSAATAKPKKVSVLDKFPDIRAGEHTRLSTKVEYGFNDVWGHHANFDLEALVPLNKYFDLGAGVQLSTANVYTFNVEVMPKFPLTVKQNRELYLDTRLLYRAVVRNKIHDFSWAFGMGYRQDYVDIFIGFNMRMMDAMRRRVDNNMNEMVSEAMMPIYSLEVFGRPRTCNWNVSARIANFDQFQIEHMWNPIFSIAGQYDPTEHWRVLARVICKPAGMFNMTASFFDIHCYAGFVYTF
ncbi:MAG: hypothetical protein IJS73_05225 [Paludibacteraceae bacterium]|nr:hypothetical protein [Paludibacteraceae bacterium]